MEKIVAALWGVNNATLLANLPTALHSAGTSKVRINIRDAAVAAISVWASPRRETSASAPGRGNRVR